MSLKHHPWGIPRRCWEQKQQRKRCFGSSILHLPILISFSGRKTRANVTVRTWDVHWDSAHSRQSHRALDVRICSSDVNEFSAACLFVVRRQKLEGWAQLLSLALSLLPSPSCLPFLSLFLSYSVPVPHLPPLCLQASWSLTCRPRGSVIQEGGMYVMGSWEKVTCLIYAFFCP